MYSSVECHSDELTLLSLALLEGILGSAILLNVIPLTNALLNEILMDVIRFFLLNGITIFCDKCHSVRYSCAE